MDKVALQFMTSPRQKTIGKALLGEDAYGPFSTVEELIAFLGRPDFASLNEDFLRNC